MTFTIFHKIGEYIDRNGDWDGDERYSIQIEVPDEKVYYDCAELIYARYIKAHLPEISKKLENTVILGIKHFLEDLDCLGIVADALMDELQDKYQEEHDHG